MQPQRIRASRRRGVKKSSAPLLKEPINSDIMTKKQLLEQGIKDGTLDREQLDSLTVKKIEAYTDKHGIVYEKDVLKPELVDTVYENSLLVRGINVGEAAPEVQTGPSNFELLRRQFGTMTEHHRHVELRNDRRYASTVKEDIKRIRELLDKFEEEINQKLK
jgi:hypothetical protein